MTERLDLNRVGGKGWGDSMVITFKKVLRSVPVVVDGGEEDYIWGWGRPWGMGSASMMITLKMG